MDTKTFKKFSELTYKNTGIVLNESKKVLLISRISKRLKALKIDSPEEYYEIILKDEEELLNFINRITTNKTGFFREKHHFDFLLDLLEKKYQNGENLIDFRVWSSASSIGSEPYSIAMVLKKFSEEKNIFMKSKILATDLDTEVLKKAENGIYPKESLNDIPVVYRKYVESNSDNTIKMNSKLKDILTFKRFNLMNNFPFKHGFDVVFCRNVIIYFNSDDKAKLITKMHHLLRESGILFLGHSEVLITDNTVKYKNLGKTIFQKI